jgi:hypothetical protein
MDTSGLPSWAPTSASTHSMHTAVDCGCWRQNLAATLIGLTSEFTFLGHDCAWFTAEFTASQIGLTAEFTFCGQDRAGSNAEFTAWFAAGFTAGFTAVFTAEFTLLPSMGHCGISFGRRSSDLSRSYLEQAVRVFIGAALHAPPGHP